MLEGKYVFAEEDWSEISKGGKDIIKKMLTYDPNKRISAEQALQHEWVKDKLYVDSNIKSDKVLKNLMKFRADYQLQKAVLLYIISFFDLKDEKDELLKTFKQLDIDHDGQLTEEELLAGYTQLMGQAEA